MSFEWPVKKLKDLSIKITKGSTPTARDGGFSESGINFIKAESVTLDGRINTNTFQFVRPEIYEKYARSKLEEEDILFSMAGMALGKVAIVQSNHLPANTNQALAVIRLNKEIVIPKYIYYFLRQRSVVHFVNNAISQSAQPNINLEQIGSLEIAVPPKNEQIKISNTLDLLDRKIDSATQINQTLEAMAQAIFKSWFVDFDPVRAKADVIKQGGSASDATLAAMQVISGKTAEQIQAFAQTHPEDYQQLHTTASLFPSAFQESELGEIPEGWEVKRTEEISEVRDGTHDSPKRCKTGFPLITSKHISDGKISTEEAYLISEEDYKKVNMRSKVDTNDILLTMIGTVGNAALVMDEEIRFAIKNIGLFKTSNNPKFSIFVFLSLKSENLQSHIFSRLAGTTQKYISLGELRKIQVVTPNNYILKSFNDLVSPFFACIKNGISSRQNLEKIRDSLLPKLLSGEIDVSQLTLEE